MMKREKPDTRLPAFWLATIFSLLLACAWLQACGGGSVVVSAGKPGETNIGSPLPSAIRIPRVASLEGSAYVITTSFPLNIFRYDLREESPYPFVPYGLLGKIQGIPDELIILDEDNAFFTTSGGIADAGEGIHLFDPNPPVPEAFSLKESVSASPVILNPPLPDSEGDPVSGLQPRYTSGVAESNGKLYVCTSNFTATGGSPVCPPGTVFIYDWNPGSAPATITASDPSFLVTTGFNPTEVTALGERFVLVTNTGVVAIRNAWAVPLTEGSVDVIDTELDCIVASYPLGLGAPSYKPIAIAPDGSRALLGSVAYNSVYELDLTVLNDLPESCPDSVPLLEEAVLAGVEDPIVVGPGVGTVNDFIVQVVLNWNGTQAYATGYNSGTVSILDVETREGVASPKSVARVLALTPPLDPLDPTQKEVGPGPLAVRPGRPGIDYTGPDLFVLTGMPTGKMLSIRTY